MRGIPIPFEQVPKTSGSAGRFQSSRGLEGLRGDASASVRAAGNFAQANARGLAVSEQSAGLVGEAVAGEGQKLLELKIKQNEAIGIRKEQEAVTSMDLEEEALSADLKMEPDETKWAAIAEKRGKALSDRVLTGDLSPASREAIGLRLGLWQKRMAGVTQNTSALKSFEKAGDSIRANIERSVDRGDFMGAQALGRKAVSAGYYSEEQFARLEGSMQDRAQKNKSDAAYDFAITNTDVFLADPDRYTEGLDARQKDSILTQARQAQSQAQSDQADAFSDQVAGGKFATLADLQSALPADMRPSVRKQFEDAFVRSLQPGIKAKLEADAPANFARFSDAVDAYDAKDDPEGERYAELVMTVKQAMPEELRGEILGPLYQKRPGATGEIQVSEPLKQTVNGIVNTMFEAGAFGNFKHPVVKKDKYGADKEPVIEENPKEKSEAYGKRGNAMIYMKKWTEANPDADPAKVNGVLREFLMGNAPAIRSTVSPVRATSAPGKGQKPAAPWEIDLPSEPSIVEPDGLLLPGPPNTDLEFNN